jgi:3-oxoacyl-(acyl-carrier-protein) synthase
MSMITPLGRTMKENWKAILDGKCAFTFLPDMTGPCRIGGRLPDYDLPETSFKTKIHSLAKALAIDVVEDAQIDLINQSDKDKWRTGCLLANQYGVQEIRHETAGKLRLVKQMPHVVSSTVAMDF